MADKRGQVEGLIARMRKNAEDGLLLASELEAILNGDSTVGQQVNRLFKAWPAIWRTKYRREYLFTSRAKVGGAFKKLLATMTVEDIEARMAQYVESRDPFYAQASHPIELFLKAINKFAGTGAAADEGEFLQAPVVDCQHKPRCKSEQEHTRRRTQEVRA